MSKSSGLAFIEPAQPVLVDEPPSGLGWIHEIKHDGLRTQLILDNGTVRTYSRTGLDWTDRYPGIVEAAPRIAATTAIIDGEIVVQDANGRSDFRRLTEAIARAPEQIIFIAFDLLLIDGEDLRSSPLRERRAILEQLIAGAGSDKLNFSRGYEGNGHDVFKAAEQLGLEGIVSKWALGPYRSGVRAGWQKAKTMAEAVFDVIGADTTPTGEPVALLSAEDLYVGQAVLNLDQKMLDAFWGYVATRKQPRSSIPVRGRWRTATWINPGLTAKVKHLRGEPEELQHASVLEITLPRQPEPPAARPARSSTRPASASARKTQP